MIFRVILCCLAYICAAFAGLERGVNFQSNPKEARCLTGYMTDIQQWVDETGRLINHGNISSTSIVISTISRAVAMLEWELSRQMNRTRIQYLSMANCGLTHVPSVFQMSDNRGQALADTIEYVTFYGNYFGIDSDEDKYNVTLNATQGTEVSADITSLRKRSTLWSVGFQGFIFTNLKELDLRSCSIQAVGNHTFQTMVKLKRIYLGENNIHYIEANAFSSLVCLKHLDLSRNYAYDDSGQSRDMIFESLDVFRNTSLESLDFSFTKFGVRNVGVLKSLERSLKSLSICHSEITNANSDVFYFSLLKILDVSGNNDILCVPSMFPGLNNTLEIMYADKVGFRNMEYFQNYSKLEILKLTNNEVSYIPPDTAITLRNLQILDLDNNRMVSWFNMTFSSMPKLKLLSLRNNNINTLENEMYEDLKNLSYISLSGNFLVCNCHVGDLYDVALNNEYMRQDKLITPLNTTNGLSDIPKFHKGFQDFNNLILLRRNITNFCRRNDECDIELNPDVVGNYLLLDYGLSNNVYNCMIVNEGRTIPVFKLSSCAGRHRESDIMENYVYSWKKTVLFIIPVVLLTIVFFVFAFRKKLRYFIITMRNLSMLSLINKKTFVEEGGLFNYDVFVSYCNEDRAWVLHQLLPQVEKDCNISVCLHERDFQVGLSILENIVSCMDRSRSIMLIISKKFLLSQWCQFEMHLAQHRLLETRREDLILVLLEEIPRRLRPKTLHYLMLTKTYLVFPKGESERNLFWKRMKKSIITHKLKHQQNVSLA